MNRNSESYFSLSPQVDIPRSIMPRPQKVLTSFNVGELIPFYVDEVLPGDTHQIATHMAIRTQPMVSAPFDDLFLDKYYFFVPSRLVWEHWKNFQGEAEDAWMSETEYTVPQIEAPEGGWNVGTIADYMGIPTGVDNISVNSLPFRALGLIYDEWFRDENLIDPIYVPKDETTVIGVNTGDPSDFVKGGLPPKVAKFHDYFTSCLPAPQRHPDMNISIGQGRVMTDTLPEGAKHGDPVPWLGDSVTDSLAWYDVDTGNYFGTFKTGNTTYASSPFVGGYTANSLGSTLLDQESTSGFDPDDAVNIAPANLISIMEPTTINELRTAFQLQRLFERDARSGSRYIESLKAHFGVTSPDARLQRPEYLGGNRISLNISQVVQTSNTTEDSPQANVAGMSLTSDSHGDFISSFTEHGFIIGVMCVRYHHTYQQGIERFWSRKSRYDYYLPVLANLGEQAVLKKEICATGTESSDESVFGYQERWAEYRYKPSRVSGEMRSQFTTPLDMWHFADDYSNVPSLSEDWILEDKSNVDRVLAVSSAVSNQLYGDIYIDNKTTRPMPMHSVPGLIDHN